MALQNILENIAANIPDCTLISVVDLTTGMSMASVIAGDELSAAAADAYHSDLYRLIKRAMEALNASSKRPENIVLCGDRWIYFSMPLASSTYFLQIVTKTETTIGFTQAQMRKFQPEILESMKGLI